MNNLTTHNLTTTQLEQQLDKQRAGIEQLRDLCLSERNKAFEATPMRAGEVQAFNFIAERLDDLLSDTQ